MALTGHLFFPPLLPHSLRRSHLNPKPNPTLSFRSSGIRAVGGSVMLGDFGARDPFPAEIASSFAEKVLGNVDTEHKILIPNVSALSLSQQQCSPLSPFQPPMSTDEAQKLLRKGVSSTGCGARNLALGSKLKCSTTFIGRCILMVIGWRLLDEEGGLKLQCLWKLRDFNCGVQLINRICEVTEAAGHYPNLHLEQPNQEFENYIESTVEGSKERNEIMKFDLKPPPYPLNALEPHMSQRTLEYHWGKHHRGYVDNLNKQIVGTELDALSLEDVIITSYNKGDILPTFNNAAQVCDFHDFFWESIRRWRKAKWFPPEVEEPGVLDSERDLVSFGPLAVDKANRLDVGNAINPSPSDEDKKLVILKTPNAVNPLVWDCYPLLTIDVWEHAYYLDFQVMFYLFSVIGRKSEGSCTAASHRIVGLITYLSSWRILYHGMRSVLDLRLQRPKLLKERGKQKARKERKKRKRQMAMPWRCAEDLY
ncbi:Superoxide dismutase [Fe] 2, chloroplastic [Morella rubra]|uniref:superoxide dismutase n=1 Tax=Morella rubra TaxID=262757 RepID=A0A6A1UW93_9ROSI|nr:Superoxide dismutase [Fe] 2, chloroplastic [Morella rubra]